MTPENATVNGMPVPGSILVDRYRVDTILGYGGMGSVVKVTDIQTDRVLALKTMLSAVADNPELRARFLREGRAAEQLRSEHVARVFDVGVLADGAPYIAMEYLQGTDLADELRRRMLRPAETIEYILQACVGLAEAHAIHIVHRDIKPSNLFVTRRADGSALVKVLDFGISKAPALTGELDATRSDIVMGTPTYMSPEQMQGMKNVDARTDIWSLGIVLYECLAGRRPFEGSSFSELILKVSNNPLPPLPTRVPRGLQAVIKHCLEKERDQRFPSVVALASELAACSSNSHSARLHVARARIMANQRIAEERQEVAAPAAPAPEAPAAAVQAATTLPYLYGTPYPPARTPGSSSQSRKLLLLLALFIFSITSITAGILMISK